MGCSELLIRIGETMYLIEKNYKRKKEEIEISGTIYKLEEEDKVKIVHKNHKMNSNKIYEYNDVKYKLVAYLCGKSTTREIERLIGKKDNFMLINIMMQNDNISFKNKNQSERKKILTQILDLEKYEKIRKEVMVGYSEEKIKRDYLQKNIKGVSIIEIEEDYKRNITKLSIINKTLIEHTEKLNTLIKIKEELMRNYTKINEEKIKDELKIRKQIEKIKSENIENDKELKELGTVHIINYDKTEIYEIFKKKTLYETRYTIENIEDEIKRLKEDEEMYETIKDEYERICNEYNLKKELLSKLDYEQKSIKIMDKRIKTINKVEELMVLRSEKESIKYVLDGEIKKIEMEMIDNEGCIIEIEGDECNGCINELYEINEKKRQEKDKYEYDRECREKLLEDLEKHEYNPDCEKCMKNPKVLEMYKIREELKVICENKDKIIIDETISSRKRVYDKNKQTINKLYKSRDEKGKLLKRLEEDRINNDRYLKEIDNKKRLIEIMEEREGLEIDKRDEIKKKMDMILIRINDKKDLESERVLIMKNEDMKRSNKKCEEELKKIIEMENKIMREKDIMNKNNINMILLEKLYEEKEAIENEKKNKENNKIIKEKTDEIEKEIKMLTKEILIKEKEKMRDELESVRKEGEIEKYKKNVEEWDKHEKEYKRLECYNDVLDKNGISLYIINKYLEIITKGINKIIGGIINKRVEMYEMSDNIIINIYDNKDNIVDFVGGMETFIIDISMKITMSKIMELSKCNFLFIDEGISSFDKDNLGHIEELFYFLNQHYDYIFLMSHIEQIKEYVSQKIMIVNEDGYSKIV